MKLSYGNTITSQSGTPSTSLSRNQASSNSADMKKLSNVSCNYCKRKGHPMSECFILKRKQQLKESIKHTNFTSLRSSSHYLLLCWKQCNF